MVKKLVRKIVDAQLREGTIPKEDENVYIYGYTLVCEVVMNILIALLIGVVFRQISVVFLFLVTYIPLRSFCGGWHADKIWKCTIYSNIILIIIVLIDDYCIQNINKLVFIGLFMVCALLIAILAPIDTITKPISAAEKKVYKKKILLIMAIHIILLVIAMLLNMKNVVFVFAFAYITQVVMLVLEIINKKSIKDEK